MQAALEPDERLPEPVPPAGKPLSRTSRFLLAAGICLVVIAILGGTKFAQISSLIRAGKAAEAAGPPPEAVATDLAAASRWESTMDAVGTVAAVRGVTISAEIAGVVRAIRFESGAKVREGQILVELDTTVERAQLASLNARLALASSNATRTRRLTESGAYTTAQLENDEAQLETITADAEALKAQIERKVVRAPFAGKLGIRQVNLGQYVNPGTAITALESLESVFVDFTIPQQDLARVPVGAPTRIVLPGTEPPRSLPGSVAAVDPNVDSVTRAVKLRASVKDGEDELRPGMFVNVSVELPERANVVSIPATAVLRAPYGDTVFVIETRKDDKGRPVSGPDGKPAKVARQQFVRLGPARGDFIAVAEGLSAGEEVVVQGAFKLRNGAPVLVNNQLKLTPSLTPRPENR